MAIEDRLHVLVVLGRREHEVLDRDEVVLERLGLVFGLGQERHRAPPEARLTAAAHLRQGVDARFEILGDRLRVGAGLFQERASEPLFLTQDRDQDVLRDDLGVAPAHRHVHRGPQRFLALRRQSIHSHGNT